MDFMTAFPYAGIIILVVINALFVYRTDIEVEEGPDSDSKPHI